MKSDTRERILAVERIVSHHYITVLQIIRRLDNVYGIKAERKSIYQDLAVLTTFVPLNRIQRGGQTYWMIERVENNERNH